METDPRADKTIQDLKSGKIDVAAVDQKLKKLDEEENPKGFTHSSINRRPDTKPPPRNAAPGANSPAMSQVPRSKAQAPPKATLTELPDSPSPRNPEGEDELMHAGDSLEDAQSDSDDEKAVVHTTKTKSSRAGTMHAAPIKTAPAKKNKKESESEKTVKQAPGTVPAPTPVEAPSSTDFDMNAIPPEQRAMFAALEQDANERAARRKMRTAAAEQKKEDGNAYFKAGKLTEALECFSEALQEAPWHVPSRLNRVLVHWKLHNLDAAMEDATRVLDLEPENAKAAHLRSKIRWEANQKEAAVEDATLALKLLPNDKVVVQWQRMCALRWKYEGRMGQSKLDEWNRIIQAALSINSAALTATFEFAQQCTALGMLFDKSNEEGEAETLVFLSQENCLQLLSDMWSGRLTGCQQCEDCKENAKDNGNAKGKAKTSKACPVMKNMGLSCMSEMLHCGLVPRTMIMGTKGWLEDLEALTDTFRTLWWNGNDNDNDAKADVQRQEVFSLAILRVLRAGWEEIPLKLLKLDRLLQLWVDMLCDKSWNKDVWEVMQGGYTSPAVMKQWWNSPHIWRLILSLCGRLQDPTFTLSSSHAKQIESFLRTRPSTHKFTEAEATCYGLACEGWLRMPVTPAVINQWSLLLKHWHRLDSSSLYRSKKLEASLSRAADILSLKGENENEQGHPVVDQATMALLLSTVVVLCKAAPPMMEVQWEGLISKSVIMGLAKLAMTPATGIDQHSHPYLHAGLSCMAALGSVDGMARCFKHVDSVRRCVCYAIQAWYSASGDDRKKLEVAASNAALCVAESCQWQEGALIAIWCGEPNFCAQLIALLLAASPACRKNVGIAVARLAVHPTCRDLIRNTPALEAMYNLKV